jgi:hypothetical protein
MRKLIIVVFSLVLLLGIAFTAGASMRCGNLIVQEDTNGLEIQTECGEPVSKESFYIKKYGDVEKWVYGPDAGYMYVIYLFMGKVVEIEKVRQ